MTDNVIPFPAAQAVADDDPQCSADEMRQFVRACSDGLIRAGLINRSACDDAFIDQVAKALEQDLD